MKTRLTKEEMPMKDEPKCDKCGRPVGKTGWHLDRSGFYHWDCFDKEYTKRVESSLEEAKASNNEENRI